MSIVKKWLEENKPKYSDRGRWIHDCSTKLGVRLDTVYKHSSKIWPKGSLAPGIKNPKKAMNRADFMAKHDTATKTRLAIQKAASTLIESEDPNEDPILEDAEFRLERCIGANTAIFRRVAEEPEFRQFQFRQGDKIFWTTPRTKRWAIEEVSKAREL